MPIHEHSYGNQQEHFLTTDVAPAALMAPTFIGLTWLILSNEATTLYTNCGDGREGDASSLVVKVNASPTLNCGHTDWRLPTVDELESLAGTYQDPKTTAYWSSEPYQGNVNDQGYPNMMYVDFRSGVVADSDCHAPGHVRLVRGCQSYLTLADRFSKAGEVR